MKWGSCRPPKKNFAGFFKKIPKNENAQKCLKNSFWDFLGQKRKKISKKKNNRKIRKNRKFLLEKKNFFFDLKTPKNCSSGIFAHFHFLEFF